jgi:WhiB family transcriptional regulator, redox-sensing transcriptional regulator
VTPAHHSTNHDELWRAHSSCLDHPDPDLWFPDEGPGTEGRRICASCPVRTDCLQHALATLETFGTWGGASERVRRHLRSLLNVSPHPDEPRRHRGCRCMFCQALDEHDQRMRALAKGQPADRIDTRGPNVRHGTPSCYPKGCRRPECLAALREWRRARREQKRLEAEAQSEAS